MYFQMVQRLTNWLARPPWRGLSQSRYNQVAYRTEKSQNLVNRRPMKMAMQIWAGREAERESCKEGSPNANLVLP